MGRGHGLGGRQRKEREQENGELGGTLYKLEQAVSSREDKYLVLLFCLQRKVLAKSGPRGESTCSEAASQPGKELKKQLQTPRPLSRAFLPGPH